MLNLLNTNSIIFSSIIPLTVSNKSSVPLGSGVTRGGVEYDFNCDSNLINELGREQYEAIRKHGRTDMLPSYVVDKVHYGDQISDSVPLTLFCRSHDLAVNKFLTDIISSDSDYGDISLLDSHRNFVRSWFTYWSINDSQSVNDLRNVLSKIIAGDQSSTYINSIWNILWLYYPLCAVNSNIPIICSDILTMLGDIHALSCIPPDVTIMSYLSSLYFGLKRFKLIMKYTLPSAMLIGTLYLFTGNMNHHPLSMIGMATRVLSPSSIITTSSQVVTLTASQIAEILRGGHSN